MSVGDRGWCSQCKTDVRQAWCGVGEGHYFLRCDCPRYGHPQHHHGYQTLARRPSRQQTRVLGGRLPEPVDKQAIKELFE